MLFIFVWLCSSLLQGMFTFEPCHEIMVLFVLRKPILQSRMRSHPVGLDVWFLVGPFVYFHISCVRTVKALARLRRCAGSPEHSLVAYVVSTIISWAESYSNLCLVWYIVFMFVCSLGHGGWGRESWLTCVFVKFIMLVIIYVFSSSWCNCYVSQ